MSKVLRDVRQPSWIAGEAVDADQRLTVRYPYSGEEVGSAAVAGPPELERAVEAALAGGPALTRHQRFEVLERARALLGEHAEELAALILSETGLAARETAYEVRRAQDVLRFAAMEALRDDGQAFSADVTEGGPARRIFTMREPLRLAAAITPFNHPLNQVAHKLAPAIAAGTPMVLKPSEKTPLSALRLTELLYEAGLPGWMLSCLVGPIDTVVEPLVRDARVELVSFTGSATIGRRVGGLAGYKKVCLELGGNSPLIVLADADLDLAVQLAAEGCFRNSGQRCTSVKRLLVHEAVLDEFTERFVERARDYVAGDPTDPATRVGTVIDEAAAERLERVVRDAVGAGAEVLLGGERRGALLPPTVIAKVPRTAEMVVEESFGPLAPILSVRDVDDAIELANATAYGLAAGVVTDSLDQALRVVRGVRTGMVNVNAVPGFRIESSPFGGVKDSGLGIKEGVIEAMKFLSTIKTFSLPW
ncbi:MAG: aldehyde dehydrogenase family protein [Planctomycetota bacterium]